MGCEDLADRFRTFPKNSRRSTLEKGSEAECHKSPQRAPDIVSIKLIIELSSTKDISDIQLGKFRLPVGAQIFISETSNDLVVAL